MSSRRARPSCASAAPIAVFDSGVGGLTVLKELVRSMPRERFVDFGDTARVPYGTKSPDTILRYSVELTAFVSTFEPKVIVVACNTASAVALPRLKSISKAHVCGVGAGRPQSSGYQPQRQNRRNRNRGDYQEPSLPLNNSAIQTGSQDRRAKLSSPGASRRGRKALRGPYCPVCIARISRRIQREGGRHCPPRMHALSPFA